jgi:uncharacterized membrane protein
MESSLERTELHTEKTVYELFKWSVIAKGIISLGEVFTGLALLVIPKAIIVTLVQGLGVWLSAHTDSAIAAKVVGELAKFGNGTALFVAFYLLSRGLIKCFLIWGLLKNLLWAYPASLFVLGMFVLYQLYEILTAGSVFVIAITMFDLVVMYFIWREWRIVTRRPA